MTFDKTTITSYTWGVLAAAVLLILGSIMWAASTNSAPTRSSAAYAQTPEPPRTTPPQPAPAQTSISSGPTAYVVGPAYPQVRVRPVTLPLVVPRPVEKPKPKQHAGVADSIKDMFPVGNVTANPPRVAHPYRSIPELFPSFQYRERMWSATGTFVTADEVLLESVGHTVGERPVFALANTSAPWEVLFVQSTQDPAKFAIYR